MNRAKKADKKATKKKVTFKAQEVEKRKTLGGTYTVTVGS